MIHEISSIRLQAASDVTFVGFTAFNISSTHGRKKNCEKCCRLYLFKRFSASARWKQKYLSTHTHIFFFSENWFDKYLIFTRKISENQSAEKIMKKSFKRTLDRLSSRFMYSRSEIVTIKNCFICGETRSRCRTWFMDASPNLCVFGWLNIFLCSLLIQAFDIFYPQKFITPLKRLIFVSNEHT